MKKWMKAGLLSLTMLIFVGCGSIPTGDGGAINMKKDGFTIHSGDGQQGSVDVSVNDDGEMKLSGTDESGQKFEQRVSKGQTLPGGFPQDIPIPEGIELSVIESELSEGTQFIVSYTAEGKVIDVYNQYREYVEQAGYATIIDASEGNAKADTGLENILAKSDGETLTIGIMASRTGKNDDGTITVNVMYSEDIE